MELVKLKSIHYKSFYSRGESINPNQIFEDTKENAISLVNRGLAVYYSDDVKVEIKENEVTDLEANSLKEEKKKGKKK